MVPVIMGRKRKHNKNYPRHLQVKKGWFFYVRVIKKGESPKWFPLKTQNEEEALKRWASVEGAINKEIKFDPEMRETEEDILFPDFINECFNGKLFDDDKSKKNTPEQKKESDDNPRFAASTLRNYKRMAKALKKQFNMPLNRIDRKAINEYHKILRKTPYEANRRIALLSVVLQEAVEQGHITVNPAFRIKKYREKGHRLKLTEEILFKKIYPVADPMLKRAIMFAFHLVQHENEIKNLEWSNFSGDVVSFVRRKTDEPIVINFSENKTLKAFVAHVKETRGESSSYVICHQSKTGWVQYEHFRSMWNKALEDAGYQKGDFKFKEIRHLANTRLKDANVSADKRRAMTGHTTIQANEDYTHPTGADTIDSSRALSRFRPDKF